MVIRSFLRKDHILSKIDEQVHFARKRFGRYEVINFLAVIFGYAISGERIREEFYESLRPFAIPSRRFLSVIGCLIDQRYAMLGTLQKKKWDERHTAEAKLWATHHRKGYQNLKAVVNSTLP